MLRSVSMMLLQIRRTALTASNVLYKRSLLNKICQRRWRSSGVVVSNEVREALTAGRPVVALESTIITHGMAFPHNLNTAKAVENIIREEGAVPATVGILEGQVYAGLSHSQLHTLATSQEECVKTSRRDFPYVLAKGLNGGTTVSGTMIIANKVGIPIFVTGGIGGVHRGGENSLDVSADLTELGRTPVTVVAAGVKSILDVGRTLEYLETQGVCVSVLGKSTKFPDFFTVDSGFRAPCHVETPHLVAAMMMKRADLGLDSGMLVAVPIPEEHQAEGQVIKEAIEKAVEEASSSVSGRDVTPFILQRVSELTGGQSLKSNIALIENNARVGAKIAVEYASLQTSPSSYVPPRPSKKSEDVSPEDPARPVVVGGSIVDFVATVMEPQLKLSGQTHRGSLRQSYGGVGRNLADALARLHTRPFLVSAVGDDTHATALAAHNTHMDQAGLAVIEKASTAVYCVVLDQGGEALFGVGDMTVHDHITPAYVSQYEDLISQAPLVVVDGNLSQATINYLLDLCSAASVPVWYEPTDVQKAAKPWQEGRGSLVTFTSPNLNELQTICSHLRLGSVLGGGGQESREDSLSQLLTSVLTTSAPLLHHSLTALMVTMGARGFMIVRRASTATLDSPLLTGIPPASPDAGAALQSSSSVTSAGLAVEEEVWEGEEIVGLYFPPPPSPHIISVSGAGDCLAAGFITGMLSGRGVRECAALGQSAALLSLSASPAVPATLTPAALPWGTRLPCTVVRLGEEGEAGGVQAPSSV